MSTQTAERTQFDAELKKTDLGTVIVENKGLFGVLLALILAGAIGFGFYQKSLQSKNEEAAKIFYGFSTNQIEKFNNKELTADQLVSSFNTTMSTYTETPIYFGATLEVFDAVAENPSEAIKLISGMSGSNIYQIYTLAVRKAAAFEALKQYDKAIAALSLINSEKFSSVAGKTKLDLGRLYLLSENQAAAKTHFEEVLKTTTQAEFKSLASYYLTQIK